MTEIMTVADAETITEDAFTLARMLENGTVAVMAGGERLAHHILNANSYITRGLWPSEAVVPCGQGKNWDYAVKLASEITSLGASELRKAFNIGFLVKLMD